jgi:hypothetical protein
MMINKIIALNIREWQQHILVATSPNVTILEHSFPF